MHAGNEDDGSLTKPRMLTNHLGELKPVYVRHADVHQHHGDIMLEQMFERLAPGVRLNKVLSQWTENSLVAQQFPRLVINHENVDLLVRRCC